MKKVLILLAVLSSAFAHSQLNVKDKDMRPGFWTPAVTVQKVDYVVDLTDEEESILLERLLSDDEKITQIKASTTHGGGEKEVKLRIVKQGFRTWLKTFLGTTRTKVWKEHKKLEQLGEVSPYEFD